MFSFWHIPKGRSSMCRTCAFYLERTWLFIGTFMGKIYLDSTFFDGPMIRSLMLPIRTLDQGVCKQHNLCSYPWIIFICAECRKQMYFISLSDLLKTVFSDTSSRGCIKRCFIKNYSFTGHVDLPPQWEDKHNAQHNFWLSNKQPFLKSDTVTWENCTIATPELFQGNVCVQFLALNYKIGWFSILKKMFIKGDCNILRKDDGTKNLRLSDQGVILTHRRACIYKSWSWFFTNVFLSLFSDKFNDWPWWNTGCSEQFGIH